MSTRDNLQPSCSRYSIRRFSWSAFHCEEYLGPTATGDHFDELEGAIANQDSDSRIEHDVNEVPDAGVVGVLFTEANGQQQIQEMRQ